MTGFTIATEIDLSLILTVIGCTATAIGFVVKSYSGLQKKDGELETEIRLLQKELVSMAKSHETDIKNLGSKIDDGFTRIERAVESIAQDMKLKADK